MALEVLLDYLDGLTESPTCQAPQAGRCLFGALADALSPTADCQGDYFRHRHGPGDGGYMSELVGVVRAALGRLPGTDRIAGVLRRCATRGAEAQLLIHAATPTDSAGLEAWALPGSQGTSLQWREYLAGSACSVLGAHALIAAAADSATTPAQARAIDELYLSISVLPTILDSVIDYEQDRRRGQPGYVRHYDGPEALLERLQSVLSQALADTRRAPHAPHHIMTLVGVVAYYTSAPTARSEFARPLTRQINRQLRPLIGPTLAMMRTWRGAQSTASGSWGDREHERDHDEQLRGSHAGVLHRACAKCGDHHRRQRTLGKHAQPVGQGGSRGGRRHAQGPLAQRG